MTSYEDHGAKTYDSSSSSTNSGKVEKDEKVNYSGSIDNEAQTDVRSVKKGRIGEFFDSFKPAVTHGIDTTGMTEEEIINLRSSEAPLAKTMPAYTLSMMAIGGAIGSGLFVGSGDDLADGGPAAVILGFFVVGIMIYFMMYAAAEQAVRFNVSGSYTALTIRLVDESYGVACGWCYALLWVCTLPLELDSAALIMSFWDTDDNAATNANPAAWIALFWVVLSALGCSGAYVYATSEAIFSIIKVVTIIGFCIFGIVAAAGGVNGHYYGAHYWHDPGAFNNGFKGFANVFINAAFACSGAELAILASSETANPHKVLPSVVKKTFWRIMLFYIVSLTICFCLVPSTNPNLGVSSDGSASPFVLAIREVGVHGLPSVVNTVILLSALSVGNASVFAGSRTLCAIAEQGGAPKFLGYIDRKGRPLVALAVTILIGALGFIGSDSENQGVAFDWLMSLSAQSTLFCWLSICVNHIMLRWAMKEQGRDLNEQFFTSPYGVWGSFISIGLNFMILGLQIWIGLFPVGSDANGKTGASVYNFFEIWLTLPLLLVIGIGHKLWYRHPVRKAATVDIVTGARIKTEEDRDEEYEESEKLNARPAWIRIPIKVYTFWC